MEIEARQNIFETLLKTHDIKGVLKGRRDWSKLEGSHLLSILANSRESWVETVTREGENTIFYEQIRQRMGTWEVIKQEIASGQEINDPQKPWAGRIRIVDL